jgi:DNA-directed RNA polymerase specialized sigma24 family protein
LRGAVAAGPQKELGTLSSQRLGGGDPVFVPGEAEEMVRELRGHLRADQELQTRKEVEAAARARALATSITGELARRLERRFEHHARAAFDDAPELIDDAVGEMFAELCRRLRDISGANDVMERRFNLTVKALMIDAIRKVRVHNGFTKTGARDTAGFAVVSLEAANERATDSAGGDRVALPLDVADPVGEDGYVQVAERLLGRVAVGWLHKLPHRQRRVVEDRLLDGRPWAVVAARAGVSAKTAQSDLEQALDTLRQQFAQNERGARHEL